MYIESINFNRDFFSSGLNPDASSIDLTIRGTDKEITNLYSNLINNRGDLKMFDYSLKDAMTCMTLGNIKKEIKAPMFGGAFFDENNELVYIEKVLYNKPATIVFWNDGTKTVSKCDKGDTYSAEMGLALAVMKKLVSNEFVSKTLHDWVPAEDQKVKTLTEVRKEHKDTLKAVEAKEEK